MTTKYVLWAYCFPDGILHFGSKNPPGSLVVGCCRYNTITFLTSWQDEVLSLCVRVGRNYLIHDRKYEIPGVAGEPDQSKAVTALSAFEKKFRQTLQATES